MLNVYNVSFIGGASFILSNEKIEAKDVEEVKEKASHKFTVQNWLPWVEEKTKEGIKYIRWCRPPDTTEIQFNTRVEFIVETDLFNMEF